MDVDATVLPVTVSVAVSRLMDMDTLRLRDADDAPSSLLLLSLFSSMIYYRYRYPLQQLNTPSFFSQNFCLSINFMGKCWWLEVAVLQFYPYLLVLVLSIPYLLPIGPCTKIHDEFIRALYLRAACFCFFRKKILLIISPFQWFECFGYIT